MPESCDRRVTIVVSHLSTKTLRLSVPFQESLTLAVEEFTLLPTPRKYHNLLCNMIEDVFCYALCFQHGTLGSDSSALFFVTDRYISKSYIFYCPTSLKIIASIHLEKVACCTLFCSIPPRNKLIGYLVVNKLVRFVS
ncbi:hypothetical protein JHK82_027368 [Glycine max]|uniref:Uncharacterized protein n=1 Tax=Glycine soja TaxID=3848 RepID=A0A0B2P997_GLYSO|nr:hypothetical protein JHK87_027269 [Glycine soja]KAG5126533.1 hypothetical protein JHK82_027368 [Glycine max]KHN05746.1 hypothetical protein glysoja_040987 [Glycine soja]